MPNPSRYRRVPWTQPSDSPNTGHPSRKPALEDYDDDNVEKEEEDPEDDDEDPFYDEIEKDDDDEDADEEEYLSI